MSVGQDLTLVNTVQGKKDADWVRELLAIPIKYEPGSFFEYNSMATYLISAIIQMVTGEKVIDYLEPRFFRPLGITGTTWQESPHGINTGGWGLFVKTEDMAKMGQFLLQKGKWNGKQILPESWIIDASTAKISKLPKDADAETKAKLLATDDWMQGYGYQLWRCRHNVFRADGAGGQFIVVCPEKDAVIITTSDVRDMQAELDLFWDHLLPAIK
jgi:CubicO group peptidase (beta-lactamase class C family)